MLLIYLLEAVDEYSKGIFSSQPMTNQISLLQNNKHTPKIPHSEKPNHCIKDMHTFVLAACGDFRESSEVNNEG